MWSLVKFKCYELGYAKLSEKVAFSWISAPNKFCSGNIAASIKSLFHGEWSSEIRWKKVRWPNWIAANFNIRKMHSTVERIDACEYSKK